MQLSDFYYDLPQELIAQTPLEQRDSSRLLKVSLETGKREHLVFSDLPNLLVPGDLLVMNDSRVIPARIFGHREGKEEQVEFFLLSPRSDGRWECLTKPGKKARPGSVFSFGNGILIGSVEEIVEEGIRLVRFDCEGNLMEALDRIGQMPLPPYITEKLNDQERYQTVYSRERGSAAAPTAGLHFTEELLETLRSKGIEIAFVTLHVGLGTFRPVKESVIEEHKMHSEWYSVSEETTQKVNQAKAEGRRVIPVGTTSLRTLESAGESGTLKAGCGTTDIFIYPGYRFRLIDGLITNFHLPESTLLMLVSALAGRERILAAYQDAIEHRYRFFSFGDAMLLL